MMYTVDAILLLSPCVGEAKQLLNEEVLAWSFCQKKEPMSTKIIESIYGKKRDTA